MQEGGVGTLLPLVRSATSASLRCCVRRDHAALASQCPLLDYIVQWPGSLIWTHATSARSLEFVDHETMHVRWLLQYYRLVSQARLTLQRAGTPAQTTAVPSAPQAPPSLAATA